MSNYIVQNSELYHYGVKGMKWGRRRYHNEERKQQKAERKQQRQEYKQQRQQQKVERKNNINKVYKKLNSSSTFAERVVYNDATRKKAAKYIVDNNMSVSEATRKAKQVAWVNTAIISGVLGAKLYKDIRG